MRNFYRFSMVILGLLAVNFVSAQEVLVVPQGNGTLNDAIAEHQGNKIYKLEAGGWYGLTAPLENNDFHLQIIGEEYDDSQIPATVQTGFNAADNLPFHVMFNANGEVTCKNIYFMNADINGSIGNYFFVQNKEGVSSTFDRCVIDPVGLAVGWQLGGGNNDIFFTNNIVARHGVLTSANDGFTFVITLDGSAGGADTVWIENNTFVSTGMTWMSGSFGTQVNNLIMVNHNTFIMHKSQLDWTVLEEEFYMTNNLFFHFMSSPYAYVWQPMPGGDAGMPKPALIYADTIAGETLPTDRINYWQYNSMYYPQGSIDLVAEMNDSAAANAAYPKVNLHPFVWDGLTDANLGADPAEAFAACREAVLFNHSNNTNTDFPLWQLGNSTYGQDPLFTDSRIYDLSDSLVIWARYAQMIHAQTMPPDWFPLAGEWPDWHWDPDRDPSINDTWPLIDATYTDAATLTGSVARLPLGDLNWYPEKMAIWEQNKDAIFQHMKDGNTEKWGSIGVGPAIEAGTLSRVYPNPMSTSATVEFTLDSPAHVEIAIINSIGQEVMRVINEERASGTHSVTFDRGDLNHGLYFYNIRVGNQSETQKLMILK
ncbi:MAG: T9SS type A sorting domain-containing protein [Bacteroidota bacterium]